MLLWRHGELLRFGIIASLNKRILPKQCSRCSLGGEFLVDRLECENTEY